ncbi:flagellar motor switch protein FliN [Sphingosinicella terrae]|jgi:flagellar motor switch protein FliN|uniref:flagellar motor switch protein FliN n=1 Tax=Sphingosinicella terrae TaxID=2172047 RepID=UPI0025495F3B|nr:flagellar motor switch protein FliN [Sphingosinicella terrae]
MDANAQEMIPTPFDSPPSGLDDLAADAAPVPAPETMLPVRTGPAVDEFEAVYDVPVKIKAVLGGARVQVGELIQMRAGTVVELDRRVGEPVDVFVNDRLIARGELVMIDGSLGVTLTETVKQEY